MHPAEILRFTMYSCKQCDYPSKPISEGEGSWTGQIPWKHVHVLYVHIFFHGQHDSSSAKLVRLLKIFFTHGLEAL